MMRALIYVRGGIAAKVTSVALIAALAGPGTVPSYDGSSQPTPSPSATSTPVPEATSSPTPTPTATPTPTPTPTPTADPQRAIVDQHGLVDAPSVSVGVKPLTRAATLPTVEDDPGVMAGTLRAGSRVVVVHDQAAVAQTVGAYEPWRERTDGTSKPYELVVAAGPASVDEALRGAFPGTADEVTSPGVRRDLLADAAPLASTGDAVQVTTVPGADLSVPGGFFAMDVSTFAHNEDSWVELTLDVSGLNDAYGADALSRMQLALLPACALTTPDDPTCLTGTLLPSSVDGDGLMSATVPAHAFAAAGGSGGASPGASRLMEAAAASGSVIVAVGAENGQGGTFTATDLAASGDWSVADQTGVFTYSLPLSTPSVDAGPVPDLGLYYNSAAVDGHNIATNGQAGLIGDGWSMAQSYIERRYRTKTPWVTGWSQC